MRTLVAIFSLALLLTVLWDGFETVVLPRRVTRRFRVARLFYRTTWRVWRTAARIMRNTKRRETLLGVYGPLSTIFLLAVWAVALILAFAMLQWSIGSQFQTIDGPAGFYTDLYVSGTNFFTLGLGDVVPRAPLSRFLTVIEGGTGFAFLALVIGYLPVIYQAFSRREVIISLLDARAGSPSSASELLRRHAQAGSLETLEDLLRDWERWSAELLESHLSYPVLCYFRSQHDNQSWIAALTTILDVCAIVRASGRGPVWQAQLTFAIARHAVVDLSQTLRARPDPPNPERLPLEEWERFVTRLRESGIAAQGSQDVYERLGEFRRLYEPYVNALAARLMFRLPPWNKPERAVDNWRTSAWERVAASQPGALYYSEPDGH